MIPKSHHHAGIGDSGFTSTSTSFSRFNFDFSSNSDPNRNLSSSEIHLSNPGGENGGDEWGDFVSTPNKDGTVNHTISSVVSNKKDDDWGLFVSSSVSAGTSNHPASTEISGQNLTNGGLQVGPTQKQEQDWNFLFSSSMSSQLDESGTDSASSSIKKIDNGDSHVPPSKTNDWASFTTQQISDRNLESGNSQAGPTQKQAQLDEQGDEWGSFFSSSASPADNTSTKPTQFTIFHEISNKKLENVKLQVDPSRTRDLFLEEEEWGEFVSSPVASTSNNRVNWEKPKGPLPLSLFGDEEDESVEEEIKIETLQKSNSEPTISVSNSDSRDLNETVANLYGGFELKDNSSSKIIENGLEANSIPQINEGKFEKNKIEDDEEEIWDFKDASLNQNNSTQTKEMNTNDWGSFASSSKLKSVPETDLSGTSPTGTSGASTSSTNESTKKDFVLAFYRRLQEGSLFLISHHMKGLNEASKVAQLSGQIDKETEINDQIEDAYEELEELNLNIEEFSSDDSCIYYLVKDVENTNLKNFEQEYDLSAKLFLAVEKLEPAIILLKHSILILYALEIASMEEINVYISTWSRILSICSQELQNGAIIWAKSLKENKTDKLISRGENYFIALGEIYRVVEILKISLKHFNTWVFISDENISSEISTLLETCTKLWDSGLNDAFEMIANRDSKSLGKMLAKSIKRIIYIDLDAISFEYPEYGEQIFCKLCLLPFAAFPDMRVVSWNGDKYLVKFANLWANMISSVPPNLPNIWLR